MLCLHHQIIYRILDTCMEHSTTKRKVTEFGPQGIEFIPRSRITALEQIRQEIEDDAIKELADAIQATDADGSTSFNLHNPIGIARLNEAAYSDYLSQHALMYQYDTSDIPHPDVFPQHILIYGHRRTIAIDRLCEEHNIPPYSAHISSVVYDDIDFLTAQNLQISENTYRKPPATDLARLITLRYQYLQYKTSSRITQDELAASLGLGRSQVADALAFSSLPEGIQSYATQPGSPLTYSHIVRFQPLLTALTKANKSSEDIEVELHILATRLWRASIDGANSKKLHELIDGRLMAARSEALCITEELFVLEGDMPKKRREASAHTLAVTALAALELIARTSPAALAHEVDRLTAIADTLAVPVEETISLFETA